MLGNEEWLNQNGNFNAILRFSGKKLSHAIVKKVIFVHIK